jgi:hypothetical protein
LELPLIRRLRSSEQKKEDKDDDKVEEKVTAFLNNVKDDLNNESGILSSPSTLL